MSRRPLFEVGEIVILVDNDHPQFNGEYPVLWQGECKDGKADVNGMIYIFARMKDGFIYDLGNFLSSTGSAMTVAHETELRKKYDPGTMSFDSMMSDLKNISPNVKKVVDSPF